MAAVSLPSRVLGKKLTPFLFLSYAFAVTTITMMILLHGRPDTPLQRSRQDFQPIGVFILFLVFGSFRSYYAARLPRCAIAGDVSALCE